jgi:predicted phage terminase large subunit-like protein
VIDPAAAAAELLDRRKARTSFADFAAWKGREQGHKVERHHKLIADALDDVERGKCDRLMIMLPPGSAKSTYASCFFPEYFLGRNPQLSVIAASHTAELAEGFGRRVRNAVGDSQFRAMWGHGLSADSTSAGRWAMDRGGMYYACGVGGSVTGRRGDCLLEGTEVQYADGSAGPIEEAVEGDQVLAFAGGKAKYCRVNAIARRRAGEYVRIHTASGSLLECTSDHRIYVGGSWKTASSIAVGDVLLRSLRGAAREDSLRGGEEASSGRSPGQAETAGDAVSMVERVHAPSGVWVYDIEVDEAHNFFANGILVHNCIIIDDPVKSREDADSERVSAKTWEWYTQDLLTRLKPNGRIVLAMTRWHESDLAGRLLDREGDRWRVIKLPMIAGEKDPLGRGEGEMLWPEWFTNDMITDAQRDPRGWSSLYQQEPRPRDGAEFKLSWIQRYTKPPAGANKIILVDPSGGRHKTSDYTSMWVVALGPDENVYVVDGVRDRLNLTQRADALFELHRKHKPQQVRYEQIGMQADVEHIQSEMERRNYRFAIKTVGGGVDKRSRIRRLVPWFENGRVWLPHEMIRESADGALVDIMKAFVEKEYVAFPVSANDDSLDCLARIAEPGMPLPWPKDEAREAPSPQWEVLDQIAGW